jgi:hypothetical protein
VKFYLLYLVAPIIEATELDRNFSSNFEMQLY